MNFCTKCSSYYQNPGTCNCYASVQPFVEPFPLYPGVDVPVNPEPFPLGQTGDWINGPYKTTCGTTIPGYGTIVNNSGATIPYDPEVEWSYTVQ